jgi:hypothetical protein
MVSRVILDCIVLHFHRPPECSFLVDAIAIVFKRYDLAVGDMTLPTSELQALERPAVAVNSREVAGNEIANLFAFAAHDPYEHAVACRLAKILQGPWPLSTKDSYG